MRATYERRVIAVLELLRGSLDAPIPGADLARRVNASRFHLDRAFKARLGETPAELGRRLRLERAAHRLANTSERVTDVALDSGFESPEAFSRAFRAAYGRSPRAYRLLGFHEHRLPAPNPVHYEPGGRPGKGDSVDLLDRLIEHDAWSLRQIIMRARELPEGKLDEPLEEGALRPLGVGGITLRQMLERAVSQKEMWTAAMTGRDAGEAGDNSLEGLLARLEVAFPAFAVVARDVRARNAWAETFTDALCDPPETFTFGGALAHTVNFAAQQRAAILEAMARLGGPSVGNFDPLVDPLSWERLAVD